MSKTKDPKAITPMTSEELAAAKDFIRSKVSREELWAQLAEEAIELAHAALKIRRAIGDANPTPVRPADAYAAVMEELADVTLLVNVLALEADLAKGTAISNYKLLRWRDRLQKKEAPND
jgi:NTP pyrophosphatase (non-canonical NTP hydrolase)